MLAVHDFDPKQMRYREKLQLKNVLKGQGLMSETGEIELNNTLQGKILMKCFTLKKKLENWKTVDEDTLRMSQIDRQTMGHFNEKLKSKTIMALYAVALAFKRGHKMETYSPTNIG